MAHIKISLKEFRRALRVPQNVKLENIVMDGDEVRLEFPGEGQFEIIDAPVTKTEMVTWHLHEPALKPVG